MVQSCILPYVLRSALSSANGRKKFCYAHSVAVSMRQSNPPWRTIDNYSKAALFFACPTVQSAPRTSLMISPFSFRLQFMAVGLCLFLFRDAAAQNQPTYMQLSPTVKAVLYSPSPNSAARVGVVNMHEDGNRLSDIACTE